MRKNSIISITSAIATVIPEVVQFDPELISQNITTLVQIVTGIISVWHFIKSIFKK